MSATETLRQADLHGKGHFDAQKLSPRLTVTPVACRGLLAFTVETVNSPYISGSRAAFDCHPFVCLARKAGSFSVLVGIRRGSAATASKMLPNKRQKRRAAALRGAQRRWRRRSYVAPCKGHS